MYQGLNEDPETFYNWILQLVKLAGYDDDAVTEQITKNTFLRGLHSEIVLFTRTIVIRIIEDEIVEIT